ncbi:MAG: hypothetical protein V3S26_00155 [Acidimicrobiia bacterium]
MRGKILGGGDSTVLRALGAASLGALTSLAAFLGVAYLLRAPELTELRHR